MTQILGTRKDKDACFTLLEQILIRHIFGGVRPSDEAQVMQHLAWMKAQTGDLSVNCKLETIEQLQMTRVVLEYSHKQITPLQQNRQDH